MSDYSWAERDDWEQAWQPVIDAVGKDFSNGETRTAADEIEKGQVRRYLEPIEFDCPLHYDEQVAKQHGYNGIIAPYSGLASWTSSAIWNPDDGVIYDSAERNASPKRRMSQQGIPYPAPPTNAGFATDVEYEYFAPFRVGDKLTVRGRKLLQCLPKETSVGRGAFMITETEVVNQDGELIAKARLGNYSYVARKK